MSLKTRLLVLVVLLVTIIVTVLSAVHLNSLVTNWTAGVAERAEMVTQQVMSLVVQRVKEKSDDVNPPPATLAETVQLWKQIVSQDKQLSEMIRTTMLAAKTIVEVAVADEQGEILVSSDTTKVGTKMRKRQSFLDWQKKEVLDRLLELAGGDRDYEIAMPLGVPQKPLIFTIQIVESSGLLRGVLMPQLYTLLLITVASLLLSIALGAFSASLAMGPLTRISKEIDRIASGEAKQSADDKDPLVKTRELAIVQSKLNMLGQQIRGAQEDVTQMRSNIESLLERMEDAVLLFDRSDTLITAGPAAERLLEISRHDMLGRTLEQLFPPAQPLGSVIQQAVRLGRPARDNLVHIERDGHRPLRLLVNVDPLADQSGTLITLRDADTRHQLAAQLDISRRLAAISRLTGGVAHEIKNPLQAITLHLELLRSVAANAEDSAGALERVNIISKEIRRLDSVVKTFLDFTRPVDLTMEDIDLSALVREVIVLVTPEAASHRVVVDFSSDPASIGIRGDRDLLKQAILNVVKNGIESMRGTGGLLKVRAQQQADQNLLTIEDQGPGIPESNRNQVFQLYFTTKEKGSGIGLAMTFRAIQLHNGTIDFTSEEGRGTTFRIRLPLLSQAD